MQILITIVSEDKINTIQQAKIDQLMKDCFSHVPREEIDECFIAESFARALAHDDKELVGHAQLFRRELMFANRNITVGGMGGVCVIERLRNRGIGHKLVQTGLDVLRETTYDVACLNVDSKRRQHWLYEDFGFMLMKRKTSLEDIHGKIRFDTGTMFVPICSREAYDYIMNNSEIFHYGRGYW